MAGALILNASYEPLCIVATRRALLLVLGDKAELISATERSFHSEHATFAEPSVARLLVYVKVPHQARVALNRRAVFARDGHRCQYCGAPAENIDHVVPRSRGGAHAWDNVVAACKRCNMGKEDRLLHETDLVLGRPPQVPRQRVRILAAAGTVRPEWERWLAPAALSA